MQTAAVINTLTAVAIAKARVVNTIVKEVVQSLRNVVPVTTTSLKAEVTFL